MNSTLSAQKPDDKASATEEHHYEKINTCVKNYKTVATQTTMDPISFNEFNYSDKESTAQDQFIEQLNQLIDKFTIRSNRSYSYEIKKNWKIDYESEIKFTVHIITKPPLRFLSCFHVSH